MKARRYLSTCFKQLPESALRLMPLGSHKTARGKHVFCVPWGSTCGCVSRAIADSAYSETVHGLVGWGVMCDESASGAVKYGLHYLHVSDAPFHDITSSLTPSHVVAVSCH